MRWHIGVPASIANLGPGFDILALAIELENEVTVTSRDDGSILVDIEEGLAVPAREDNLIARAYRLAASRLGSRAAIPGVHLTCRNRIPMGSGLGSSAAAIVSGVIAAHLINHVQSADEVGGAAHPAAGGLDEPAILGCAAEIEGHPDNIAAALLGGLVICSPGAAAQRVDLPEDLRCVVFIPTEQSSTPESRAAVPGSFSREDAVFNAGRMALLVRALAANDLDCLGDAMQDRWHQPYRLWFFPALNSLIEDAQGAGAYGASLAGAGPSVVALCSIDLQDRIGEAMALGAEASGVPGSVFMTGVRNRGATISRVN